MKRYLVRLCAALLAAEMLLVAASWLLSATMTRPVRSLLSGEGLRWCVGRFVDTLLSPLLVWLVLGAMAWGALARACGRRHPRQSRSHYGPLAPLWAAAVVTLLAGALLAVALLQPQAVLLSATGSLWPSPFSRGLVPLLALLTILFAVSYGVLAGTMTSFDDIFDALVDGIAKAAPLFVVYVLAVQFVASLLFICS